MKTKARSRRLHRDENLSREGGSIYDFGKPRVHLTAKRKSKNTAISYRISFVAHSASALKSWEGHDSGSRRIVRSKWSSVSCGSIAITPYFSRTSRSRSQALLFSFSRCSSAMLSCIIDDISQWTSDVIDGWTRHKLWGQWNVFAKPGRLGTILCHQQ